MADPDEQLIRSPQTPEIILPEKISRTYSGAVLHDAFEDFGLGKDMVIGTAISLATLGLQVWQHLIPIADWQDHKLWWILSFVLPYIIILGGHAIWRVATAPVRLHQRQAADHKRDLSEKLQLVSSLQTEIANQDEQTKKLRAQIDRLPAPEIFLHFELSKLALEFPGVLKQRKQLILENTGNIDAYDVQVEDIQIDPGHCKATFLPIRRLAKHTKQALETIVRGQHITQEQQDNFEMIYYGSGSYDLPSPETRDDTGRYWFKVPITVVFRDYDRQWYKATFNFKSDDWFTFPEISLERRERITPPVQQ